MTRIVGAERGITPDERDEGILRDRVALLDAVAGPRVGDHVDFGDGVSRRISHIWPDGHTVWPDNENRYEASVQTSDHGSYHLGESGYVSMSGGLFPGVPLRTLMLVDEVRAGAVWFFHHGWARAHSGVQALVPFRVFTCYREAPK